MIDRRCESYSPSRFLICGLGMLVGIHGCAETASPDDTLELSKEEAAQLAGAKTDGPDICAANGWYDDDECDTFCPQPDPDCGPKEPEVPEPEVPKRPSVCTPGSVTVDGDGLDGLDGYIDSCEVEIRGSFIRSPFEFAPGATVRFRSPHPWLSRPMVARGTPEHPILFDLQSSVLKVEHSGSLNFEYVEIRRPDKTSFPVISVDGTTINLSHVTIHNVSNGIGIEGAAVVTLADVSLSQYQTDDVEDPAQTGIEIWGSEPRVTIDRTSIHGFNIGLSMTNYASAGAAELLVRDSSLTNNDYGVYISGEVPLTCTAFPSPPPPPRPPARWDPAFLHTEISGGDVGITVQQKEVLLTLDRCDITDHASSALSFDVPLADGSYMTHNNLVGNGRPVEAEHDPGTTIEFDENYWGDAFLESKCDDSCRTANDGVCQDIASLFSRVARSRWSLRNDGTCRAGTDCSDCGKAFVAPAGSVCGGDIDYGKRLDKPVADAGPRYALPD